MMLDRVRVVFGKEVRDNARDRRAMVSALLYPLLGPAIIVLMFTVMERQFTEQEESQLELPVVGAEHAPALITFLGQQGVVIQEAPADPEAEVRAGDLDVVLVIPEDYPAEFSRGRPATVRIVIDDSRQASAVPIRRTRRLLGSYGRQVAALRLLARGVSPAVIRPLATETLDVATPQSQAANFLGLMPYFLIFSVFIGGMYLAIDSTAGERERGSLEPLLMNPVARWELVVGKLCAVLVFTFIAVVETLVVFALVLNVISLEHMMGVQMSLSPGAVVSVLLIVLPLMPLAAALQLIIASFTRSFKEAQNYLSLLPLVPALPGLLLMFVPVKPKLWAMLIPTFGQQLLINQVMRGEELLPVNIITSAVVTLAVALLFVLTAIRLYERERILFGRGR